MRLPTLLMLLLAPAAHALALEPIPDKLVVLTFDDSSRSHLTVAAPLLKKHGFGATFFVTEGFDFPTNKRDYMTWDEIAQLHADGFEVGNHTRDHRPPSARDPKGTIEQIEAINARCLAHGIPRTVTFAYPGNALDKDILPLLRERGIKFARRGGSPEYPYDKGRGFAYEPGLDHPLLIPSAGDARPGWTLDDFKRAVSQARGGKIAVIQLHGVPDTAHSWVNTPTPLFESYVKYLADNGYRVIALRDLARYVDPTVVPSNPWGVIEDRKGVLSSGRDGSNARPAVRSQVVIDAHRHHLGTAGRPEWQEFAGSEPEGRGLELRFEGRANPAEATLLIRQRDVKLGWDVHLNDRRIGRLHPMEAALVYALAVPAGTLRDGRNRLTIGPPPDPDDVIIEGVVLDRRPVRETLDGARLEVRVTGPGRDGDLHAGFRPFAPEQFNPVTGGHRRRLLGVDALEVINSGAMQSDPMQLVRDWMALRNRGERMTAIGASDSHDVARYIVGQGRTYIICRDDDPARLDVNAACRALKSGRALVSLGLLARMSVDDRFGVGELATKVGEQVRVSVEIHGPSWATADRVELFANGVKVRDAWIGPSPGALKARIAWKLPRPSHDVSLVAIASGPGVTAPYWAIARPYQPTSRDWTSRVFGITNPIDLDGDGAWTSPRAYAEATVARVGLAPQALLPALGAYDEATAAKAAGLCQAANSDVRDAEFVRLLAAASEPVRLGFAAFAHTLP